MLVLTVMVHMLMCAPMGGAPAPWGAVPKEREAAPGRRSRPGPRAAGGLEAPGGRRRDLRPRRRRGALAAHAGPPRPPALAPRPGKPGLARRPRPPRRRARGPAAGQPP